MKKLPCDQCRGQCCKNAVFLADEFKKVVKKKGIPDHSHMYHGYLQVSYRPEQNGQEIFMVTKSDTDHTCAYLNDGKCSIYEYRPSACRDYGRHVELPCEYLYPEESAYRNDQRKKMAAFIESQRMKK